MLINWTVFIRQSPNLGDTPSQVPWKKRGPCSAYVRLQESLGQSFYSTNWRVESTQVSPPFKQEVFSNFWTKCLLYGTHSPRASLLQRTFCVTMIFICNVCLTIHQLTIPSLWAPWMQGPILIHIYPLEHRHNNNSVVGVNVETLKVLITNYSMWRGYFPPYTTKQCLRHYLGILPLISVLTLSTWQ